MEVSVEIVSRKVVTARALVTKDPTALKVGTRLSAHHAINVLQIMFFF